MPGLWSPPCARRGLAGLTPNPKIVRHPPMRRACGPISLKIRIRCSDLERASSPLRHTHEGRATNPGPFAPRRPPDGKPARVDAARLLAIASNPVRCHALELPEPEQWLHSARVVGIGTLSGTGRC